MVITINVNLSGLGGVLMQEYCAGLNPIAFESYKLSDRETRYAVYELNLLVDV